MTTLAEHIIVTGAENHPLMLGKSMYDSWPSRIRLFIKGKKHGRMMLDSIENAKDIWDRVKMLMKGTELSYQERECKLYNLFDKFAHVLGETLYEYYWRFSQLINDMHTIGMAMQQSHRSFKQVQGRQTQSYAGTGNRGIATTSKRNVAVGQPRVMKCYNGQREGEGHMARQCTQPKRPRNAAWFKEKLMLAEAQEVVFRILDEEKLAFLADPGISEAPVAQQTIPHNSAFQIDDLDAYDSDCNDLSSAKAVLMANLSSCDPEVLSRVPYSDSYLNNMINQDVQEMQYSKQTHVDYFEDNEIHSCSNIILYSQYLQESQDVLIQDTNPSAPNDLLVPSLVEQMTDHVAHLDKENQTNKMILEEESRSKMLDKQNDPISIEKKIKISLIDYSKLNKIKEDFGIEAPSEFYVKPTTNASGSKPSGNTKNNRIIRPPHSNQKNKVEDHSKKFKSSLNKTNSVFESISNALVKHSVKNAKFESIYAIYNKCCPDYSLVSGLWMFKTYDRKPLLAHELCSRDTNLYTISLDDMLKTSLICLLSKASKTKSWLWHRRLSHLNFSALNKLAKDGLARGISKLKFQKDHLCSAYALGKSKKSSHQPKAEDTNQEKLYLLHIDLCVPMHVESINGKKSISGILS
ncbi:retrovirus-related pol polyprotein from transposon TNT 1-94 [Tanacetum coccineum]